MSTVTEPGIYTLPEDATARFWSRVDKSDTCWHWTGSKTRAGYGNLRIPGGRFDYAHRVAYILSRGPIADGKVIDHLCRNRACVNPDHLEPVEHRTNVRRGMAGYGLRTECTHGHDITDPQNVYTSPRGDNRCRTCAVIRERSRDRAAERAARS